MNIIATSMKSGPTRAQVEEIDRAEAKERATRDAELARLESERDAAISEAARHREELEVERLGMNVERALFGRGLSAPMVTQIRDAVVSDRALCAKRGERFDYASSVRRAEHAARVAAGEKPIAPAPVGTEPIHPDPTRGVVPVSFTARLADRERYHARLRELGLLDPATSSIPGGETR